MKKRRIFITMAIGLVCLSVIFTSCTKCTSENKTGTEPETAELIQEPVVEKGTDKVSQDNLSTGSKISDKTSLAEKAEPVKTEKVIITYTTERETAPAPKEIENGTILTRADVPILISSGYEFLGWFAEERRIESGYKITKNIDLVAKWKIDEPPKPVSNLSATPGDGEITLSWRNPGNLDFEKVVISRSDAGAIEVSKSQFGIGENASKKITNLSNGEKYSFSLKTFDKSGKSDQAVTISAVPMHSLNEGPVEMAEGTEGSFGTKGKYVLFGYYPQSLKNDSVEIYDVKPIERNGLSLFSGNDGFYYVKARLTPFPYGKNYRFDDGTLIAKDGEAYFKLEPIKWRILDENFTDANGEIQGKLLMAEKVLAANLYHENLNNYEKSNLREFLTGSDKNSFLNTAFSEKSRGKIKAVTVDNSPESTTDVAGNITKAKGCNNTVDKIFVLSEYEATKPEYGFDAFDKTGENSSRNRPSTEYARATGCNCNISPQYKNNAWWWVRSPYSGNSVLAHYAGSKGEVSDYTSINESSGGVVPALVLGK